MTDNPFDFSKLGGLGGLGDIFKKAREMKASFEAKREEMAKKTIEATSGGGIVTVVADGHGIVRSIRIDPAAIVPSEKELLEDLIKAAVNEARTRAQKMMEQEMAKITAGLPIPPGLFG